MNTPDSRMKPVCIKLNEELRKALEAYQTKMGFKKASEALREALAETFVSHGILQDRSAADVRVGFPARLKGKSPEQVEEIYARARARMSKARDARHANSVKRKRAALETKIRELTDLLENLK